MPVEKYMIVNATQLDADLATIANKIKTKLNETGEYKFPEDFITAIDKMVYDANPNTIADLTVDGKNVTVGVGYYPTPVTASIDDGLVIINPLDITSNPQITINAEGTAVIATHSASQTPVESVTSGYVTSIQVNPCNVSGSTTVALTELLGNNTVDNIVDNGDGTITIPAGYYANTVSKSVDDGLVIINNLEIISNPTISLSADGKNIVVSHSNSQSPTPSTTSGYVTSANVSVGNCTTHGENSASIVSLLGDKTVDNIVNNGDGTITIPAGYYANNITYTLPTTGE